MAAASVVRRSPFGLVLALFIALASCRTPLPGPTPVVALRLGEVAADGDPARRASLRLCVAGLRAEAKGQPVSARSQYERAMQIDPTNPWAYLVLARHEAFSGDATRALEFVGQAETLLRDEGAYSPRVEPHLVGIRGAAMGGSSEVGQSHRARAAALAPDVWGDGRLGPDELL